MLFEIVKGLLIMNKWTNLVLVFAVAALYVQRCRDHYSNKGTQPHPLEIFERHVMNPRPEAIRVFDGKLTYYSKSAQVWVAFDAYESDWRLIEKKFSLVKSGSFRISPHHDRNVAVGTGFEGYIDDDYVDMSSGDGSSSATFFVRKMKQNNHRHPIGFSDKKEKLGWRPV